MSMIRCAVLALLCTSCAFPVLAADDAVDDVDLDALFELEPAAEGGSGIKFSGYGELGGAYTYADADDERWSRLRARLELAATGKLGERSRWKLAVRGDADAGVLHLDHQRAVVVVQPQQHMAALGELERVAQQVQQHLLQAQRIAPQVGRYPFSRHALQRQPLLARMDAQRGEDLVAQLL